MTRARIVAVLCALAATAVALGWWQWRTTRAPAASADEPSRGRAHGPASNRSILRSGHGPEADSRGASGDRLDHQALASAFAGTDVDGHLAADADGNLVLSLGVRDFFDYFLLAVEDVPLAEVKEFIEAYARERLPGSAVTQLMALLDDYLAYRTAASEMYQQQLIPRDQQTPEYYLDTLDKTFASLKDVRRQHMSGDAVEAFFALEEEHGQYTLDRLAVHLDKELSPDEKRTQMAGLREQLSPDLRASENQKIADAERARRIREIMDSQADDADRRAALAGLYSADQTPGQMADRVIGRDQAMRAFRARVDEYLAARAPILAVDLPADERAARIDALRREHFSDPQELIWARTYEARADRANQDSGP